MEPQTSPTMSSSRAMLWLAVIIIIAALGFAWSKQTPSETIKIGVIAPLTGNKATYGDAVKEGMELAYDERKEEKFKGQRVELIYEDTAGEVKNALSAAQKLIEIDKVVALVGGGASEEAVALAPIAEKAKVPFYAVVSQALELTDAGDYVFRGMPNIDALGVKIAEAAYARGYRKAGAITANYNQATIAFAKAFQEHFESLGGKVIFEETFGPNTTDFRTHLNRLHAKKPDVISLIALTNEAGLILKQKQELGMKEQVVSGGPVEDKKVVELGGAGVEGIFFSTFNAPPSVAFVEKVKAKYGFEPRRWNSEGYEALQFVLAGLEKAKTLDRLGVRDGFAQVRELDGVSGKLVWDEKGNITRAVHLKEIKNGQFVLIQQ